MALLTIHEVCSLLNCSRSTVDRLRKREGRLKFPKPALSLFGNRWRSEQVHEWMERSRRSRASRQYHDVRSADGRFRVAG